MGVRLSTQEDKCCMFDSVTDQAFGPVFNSEDEAEMFLTWYQGKYRGEDPRVKWFLTHKDQLEFLSRYGEWYRATHDHTGFREDIAIQVSRDATPDG